MNCPPLIEDKDWKRWDGKVSHGKGYWEEDRNEDWSDYQLIKATDDMRMPDRAQAVFEYVRKNRDRWARKQGQHEQQVQAQLDRWRERLANIGKAKPMSNTLVATGKYAKRLAAKRAMASFQIRNYEWCLKNNPREIAGQMACHQDAAMVYSAKKMSGESGNLYLGRVWIGPGELVEIELRPDWAESNFTDHAKNRLREDKFLRLTDYDRVDDLRLKEFAKIMMVDDKNIVLKDAHGYGVSVKTEWADEALPLYVVAKARRRLGMFLPISASNTGTLIAGDSTCCPKRAPDHLRELSLPIKYFNASNECIPMALANGLDYRGYAEAADHVVSAFRRNPLKYSDNVVGECKKLAQDVLREKYNTKFWYDKKGGRTYGDFLGAVLVGDPVIANIKARKDGKDVNTNHVVCFVDRFVLDSNMDYALKICKESMQLIVEGALGCGHTYAGIYWSKEMNFRKRKQQK